MPNRIQSPSTFTKDFSYRQTLFLSFRKWKVEELYQSDFDQSMKNYRLYILILLFLWIFSHIYIEFQLPTFFLLILNALRIIIEMKTNPRNYMRFFLNSVSLIISLFVLTSYIMENHLDELYFHGFALIFHYIYLPCLPMNFAIGLSNLIYYKDSPFLQNSVWECVVLYILNKRSRDLFILMDSLKKQQKTFHLMIENSPNPVFVIDMHHRIHYCNNNAKEILAKTFKNYAEKSNFGQNIMMIFDEKYHEKLNHAIFDCTLKHETSKLFQIPLITKTEILAPLLEQNFSSLSPKTLSFSKSDFKSEFVKTHQSARYVKLSNFFNISIQNTFWKGGHFFLVTLENQEKTTKLFEMSESYMNLINGLLLESLDLMEKDYQKWNNFQAIKVIKESDLKDLASIVVECNRIKALVSTLKNINQLAFERNERIPHKFNIRYTLVQCMELISIKSIEKKLELLLKFEESFPEHVYGEYEHFKQLIHCLLRIINLSPLSFVKKFGKFTLFCNLNRYSEEGRFILTFNFEYEPNDSLDNFFKELSESYNPKEPFNFYYILEHSNWALDQLALIPLFRLLMAEINPQKLEEKSIFSLEVSFDTSDQHLVSSIEKSNSHSSPGVSLLNKKPLQLSFCRISPNVNNVIWREKPQAALAMAKQQPMSHKKKINHMDFMKTSMRGGLASQLEKDKEIKEKDLSSINSNFKPGLIVNINNLNISKGTPSFEFIKKEPEDPSSNLGSSPSWKEEYFPTDSNEQKEPKDGNESKDRKESKDIKELKDIIEPKAKKDTKDTKDRKESYQLKVPSKESIMYPSSNNYNNSPQNKLNLPLKPIASRMRNELAFSQISEKEIENSIRDFKTEINEIESSLKNHKIRKNQLELEEEMKIIVLPEKVVESLDLIKAKLKGEFEKLIYSALDEIVQKHLPDRIIFENESRLMKRNFSDLQLGLYEKPMIESPKSSLIDTKKNHKKIYRLEMNQNNSKGIKKFSLRSNIIKAIVKRANKFSFENDCENFPFINSSGREKNKLSSQKNNFLGPSFEEMGCFACISKTQKRRWTLMKHRKKNSFELRNVLIIGAMKHPDEMKFSNGTYLRSLLNKRFEEARVKIFYVEGFEQIDGYLQMKLEGEEKFSYVFLEENSNVEEIQDVVRKYKEFENKLNGFDKSRIVIIGKNDENLNNLKKIVGEIAQILKLEGKDQDGLIS